MEKIFIRSGYCDSRLGAFTQALTIADSLIIEKGIDPLHVQLHSLVTIDPQHYEAYICEMALMYPKKVKRGVT